MDVKATNPDGSVRMAVLTLQQPALAAGASAGVMLQLAPAGTSQGRGGRPRRPRPTAATTSPSISACTTPTAAPRRCISTSPRRWPQALRNGTASSWLSGPQASQVRIDVPVAGSLHLTFDITAYADGSQYHRRAVQQRHRDERQRRRDQIRRHDQPERQPGVRPEQHRPIPVSDLAPGDLEQRRPGVLNGGVNVQHDTAALERGRLRAELRPRQPGSRPR